VNQRAKELRARYLRAIGSSNHVDQLIVLWRQWRYEVTR